MLPLDPDNFAEPSELDPDDQPDTEDEGTPANADDLHLDEAADADLNTTPPADTEGTAGVDAAPGGTPGGAL